jgi:hypothetical protein
MFSAQCDLAFFGSGLPGVVCTDEIFSNEAILFVPSKCMMTCASAKNSEIGDIFKNHDTLFVSSITRDQNIMLVYLVYEKLKGEASFYHPYLDQVSQDPVSYFWAEELVDGILCPETRRAIKSGAEDMNEEFESFGKLIEVYPQYFPNPELFTRDLYEWATSFVMARAFGWGTGTTALVPGGDMFNHSMPRECSF